MRIVGKIATAAVSASLVLALGACGGSAASSSAASSSSAAASSSSEVAATSSASTDAATADTYRNQSFGLVYHLPEGWGFTDISALKDSNATITATGDGETIDMVATAEDKSTSVIVSILPANEETKGKTADEILAAQIKQLNTGLDTAGVNYSTETTTLSFNGLDRELPAALTTITVDGKDAVLGQAIAEKDGYVLELIVSGASKDDVAKAFTNFAATSE